MTPVILPHAKCPFHAEGGCEAFKVVSGMVCSEIEHGEQHFCNERPCPCKETDWDDRYARGGRR